jgi:hypothetical protein
VLGAVLLVMAVLALARLARDPRSGRHRSSARLEAPSAEHRFGTAAGCDVYNRAPRGQDLAGRRLHRRGARHRVGIVLG